MFSKIGHSRDATCPLPLGFASSARDQMASWSHCGPTGAMLGWYVDGQFFAIFFQKLRRKSTRHSLSTFGPAATDHYYWDEALGVIGYDQPATNATS